MNPEEFPDFPGFVAEMKEQGVRLVPIIDAGVKEEKGYPVCDEGKAKGYFCKRADGTDFEAVVWPGWSHFPGRTEPRGPGPGSAASTRPSPTAASRASGTT